MTPGDAVGETTPAAGHGGHLGQSQAGVHHWRSSAALRHQRKYSDVKSEKTKDQ